MVDFVNEGDMADMTEEEFGTNVRPSKASRGLKEGATAYNDYEDDYPEDSVQGKTLLKTDQSNNARIWNRADDVFYEGKPTVNKMPKGLYEFISIPNVGPGMKKLPIKTDELIIPPEPTLKEVLEEFRLFWACKHKFTERGLLYKRGFLLYGEPGGGKTSLLALLMRELMETNDGFITIVDNPSLATAGLQLIRKIEPTRPLILIIEDIDALIERYGEPEFLSLLDGENHIENVVAVATTNYPDRLDKRFVNRPSRFDKLIKIGMPNADTRRAYLQAKEKSLEGVELEEWVTASEEFSLAHLKEMIVAVKCLDQPLDAVVERLKKMKTTPKSGSGRSMGFN